MIFSRISLLLACVLVMGGCSLLSPPPAPTTTADRLADFPTDHPALSGPVTLRWNDYQVPYIEAGTDRDAAFALGLVHAHLRLGQLELAKRVSQGRLSEIAGPFTRDIDTALRILDFGKAAPDILAAMRPDSRAWLDAYVAGINAYRDSLDETTRPHEYTVFNMDPAEPWTAEDSLTLGRLFGTDVNWLVWFSILAASDQPEAAQLYQDAIDLGLMSSPTIPAGEGIGEGLRQLSELLGGMGKTGSNSVVVSAEKSATGSGLIANDPHLGFLIPNAWLMAGLKSPSYHVVGMMPPGVPAFGFGRTHDIAWGGTNLRGLNSDLVDLEGLSETSFESASEALGVRAWPDRDITVRQSAWGPVISDADIVPGPEGRNFALRWVGHEVSDEMTALLDVSKARNWDEFVSAVKPFSVPAQNFLYVDRAGQIGHVVATYLPKRPPAHRQSILVPRDVSDQGWADMMDAERLPRIFNPAKGFLQSSNNKPAETDYPIGYFFPPDERQRRMEELLSGEARISLEDLAALQRDVVSPNSRAIAHRLGAVPVTGWSVDEADALSRLASWSGSYDVDSREAVLFQAFLIEFLPLVAAHLDREVIYDVVRDRPQALLVLKEDLARADMSALAPLVQDALGRALAAAENRTWGEVHRLRLGFILGRVPLIGEPYRLGDYPVGGTQETVMKTAHELTVEEHATRYGAQSRHLSDMGDPDANYFVLVGGNDGWIGSENANDQTPLWLDGEYVRLPLSEAGRIKDFPTVMTLQPEQ